MAQTSVRRDQENQAKGERFERASVMWTGSTNSHTGPRPVSRRSRGRTHGSTRSSAAAVQRFFLHRRGRPHMPFRTILGFTVAALFAFGHRSFLLIRIGSAPYHTERGEGISSPVCQRSQAFKVRIAPVAVDLPRGR